MPICFGDLMSESLCYLCKNELTGESEEGFWAITISEPDNPGQARAHPGHTECLKAANPELYSLMQRERAQLACVEDQE
jgi:hypothetical protein